MSWNFKSMGRHLCDPLQGREDVEQVNLESVTCGRVKWCNHSGKLYFIKLYIHSLYASAFFIITDIWKSRIPNIPIQQELIKIAKYS